MPRATRYLQDGYIFHLTHRCQDGECFLRFSKERNAYREWLRIGTNRYRVPILGYSVTSNHVHVVVEVLDRYAVADMMKLASGVVAQARNKRKGHDGSMWEHPYQCTRVQDGRHLLNCLRYVDLNMVRAGKVEHPEDWRWCGYDELTDKRKRYRIIDQARLLSLTGFTTMRDFAEFYASSITERLSAGPQNREPFWTESVAIGSREFVDAAERTVSYRQAMERYEVDGSDGEKIWTVREQPSSYGGDLPPEMAI
ncbi:MAG: transposase [Kiritimatiellia bacterium]|nr:transposase [Kiritimatiellia bacterium]